MGDVKAVATLVLFFPNLLNKHEFCACMLVLIIALLEYNISIAHAHQQWWKLILDDFTMTDYN